MHGTRHIKQTSTSQPHIFDWSKRRSEVKIIRNHKSHKMTQILLLLVKKLYKRSVESLVEVCNERLEQSAK